LTSSSNSNPAIITSLPARASSSCIPLLPLLKEKLLQIRTPSHHYNCSRAHHQFIHHQQLFTPIISTHQFKAPIITFTAPAALQPKPPNQLTNISLSTKPLHFFAAVYSLSTQVLFPFPPPINYPQTNQLNLKQLIKPSPLSPIPASDPCIAAAPSPSSNHQEASPSFAVFNPCHSSSCELQRRSKTKDEKEENTGKDRRRNREKERNRTEKRDEEPKEDQIEKR
jgi:hypothetical protein